MHLRLEGLASVSLAEWGQTDAEWFHEVWTLLAKYHEGRQARTALEGTRQKMQA